MTFSLTELWHSMGLPAKIVGAFLVVMGLASLTAFIERVIALRRSRAASRLFAAEVEGFRESEIQTVIAEAAKHPRSHLARLVQAGMTVFAQACASTESSELTPAERARRHLERQVEELGADLRRGLPILASGGLGAPLVRLLRTGGGLLSAFPGRALTTLGGPPPSPHAPLP